jgi:hypothetical protein
MTALLVAPDLEVDFGVELLTPALVLVSDLSSNVPSAPVVARDNAAGVQGTLTMSISQALQWGYDRVRPYMLLSSETVGVSSVRWNLGVFIMTTPDMPLDPSPTTYSVSGLDQNYLLQDNIQDSRSVPAGADVLTAVQAALTAAGILAPVLLDTTAAGKRLVTPLTWPLTSGSSPTWLVVVNALLAAIGYLPIWTDWNGAFRSGPIIDPSLKPPEWTFKVGDLKTGVVAAARTVSNDVWSSPNTWRFTQNGLGVPPVEGAGQYTTYNSSTGPSSIASVGARHAPVQFLDATSQADLVTQGDAIKATAMRVTEVLTLALSPFPAVWNRDTVLYSDPALGPDRVAQCRSWSMPLDGSDMSYVLEVVSV